MPRVKEAEQKKRTSRRCKRQARSHQQEAGALPEPAAAASHEIAMRCEKDSTEGLAAIVSSCSPLPFQGMEETMTSSTTPKRPLYPIFEASEDAVDEDAIEDVAQHVEKKRRLSVEQVKSLEKYFEVENKLEPERKLQLARELGLQPRQVAVWFQNRRARWKTKQLEKDYDALKANLDTLKADYNTLLQEKQKLEAEVDRLNNLLSSKSEAAIETPEKPEKPDIKVKVEVEVGVANRVPGSKEQDPESGFGDALNFKKDCSSSDSDDSEIVDDESPRLMESESGFSLNHHQPCSGVLDMDPLECHIPDESYAHVVYTRIPKLEDGSSFQDDSCTGTRFLDLEEQDQGSLSWWDWA